MTHSDINTLESPLFCSSLNKPIISLSTYIRNRRKNLDCNYWKVHLFDGCIEFDPRFLHKVSNSYKSNIIPSSATLSKITDITNKYFADKRIYIPGLININYYYISRGNGKSLRELLSFTETFMDCSQNIKFTPYPYVHTLLPYPNEYTAQDYESDMENLYKKIIYKKLIISLSTNESYKQRNNNQEEMSCLKIIQRKNNTTKKFHK
nr:hypothetical protein [uncultured Lachnoclostridium sp.]